HRRSHYQTQMIHAEPLRQELVLRVDHVVVRVLWKTRMQLITGLTRFSVANAVRQDHEVARRVEQLPGSEQLTAEGATGEAAARARGSVEHDHRVAYDAGTIAARLTKRQVMDAERGHRLPA